MVLPTIELSDLGRARSRRFLALLCGFALAGAACSSTPPPGAAPAASQSAAPVVPPAKVARGMPAGVASPPAVALGTHGAVASAESAASQIGLDVLKRGGSAVDAAIAVGFALAVTHPSAGNLGGGGFMVVRLADGKATTIDFREKAPGAATRDMYLDRDGKPTKESIVGAKAAGIPGTVAGLALAHEKFGQLSWKDVVTPSVRLARDGDQLDAYHAKDLVEATKKMRERGLAASTPYYEKEGGVAFVEGDVWKQPELAATLELIANEGPGVFYTGPLAAKLASAVKAAGGIWEAKDLADYQAKERAPIVFDYRGHQVITMPPPSAGGIVLRQVLAASEVLDLRQYPWHSPDEVHRYVEACRRVYADRNMLLGDPDFVKLPMTRLLDVAYMRDRVKDIDPLHATPSSKISAGLPAGQESEQTTHYSVVDEAGNAVAVTYTLNTGFGSGFVVPGTGVLLNNEMDDFSVKPGSPNVFGLVQGEPNKIEPGKRMLSSMTPTILVKDGELRAVLGSPGGPTITTTVAQLVRAMVDYEKPLDVAVLGVRIHHQWLPDQIWTEERIDPALEKSLVGLGHAMKKRSSIGHANCIEVDPVSRGFRAVADVTRDGGEAVAY